MRGKGARCVGLTTLSTSCADCLEILKIFAFSECHGNLKFSELTPMFVEYRVEHRQHLARLIMETLSYAHVDLFRVHTSVNPSTRKTRNKISTISCVHDTADFRQLRHFVPFIFH